MKKLVAITLFFILLVITILPVAVHAQINDPNTLEVNSVDVYTGVLENTDQLYIVEYEIEYNTNPAGYTSDDLFLIRLMDNTDAQLGVTIPVSTGSDNGFAEGMAGLYFSALDVANLGMTFSDNGYYMQVTGNPLATWASGTPPYSNLIDFNNYYTSNVQEQLHLRLSVQAQLLENYWAGTADLIEGTAGERILTSDGEEYFTAAIPNLRLLCPDIFGAALLRSTYSDREVVTDYYVGGDSVGTRSYGNILLAQTFTPYMDYQLETLTIKLNRLGACGDISVRLETAAGTPAGVLCASGTITQTYIELSPAMDWNIAAFDAYEVNDAQQYAIVLNVPSGSPTAYVNWRYDITGEYNEGAAWYSLNNGATWIQMTGADFMFQTGAKGADNLAGIRRLEHQLDGTIFDTSSSEPYIGLSSLWLRSVIWLIIALIITVMVARESNNTKAISPVFFFVVAVGYPISMIAPMVAIAFLVMGIVAVVWAMMGSKA